MGVNDLQLLITFIDKALQRALFADISTAYSLSSKCSKIEKGVKNAFLIKYEVFGENYMTRWPGCAPA